jgi:hypothetical protein
VASTTNSGIYRPGDDVLFTLPTSRPVDKHAVLVNFSRRFAYDSAVSGPLTARNCSAWIILRSRLEDRQILGIVLAIVVLAFQLMAAYNIFDEHHEDPFNLTFRVSVDRRLVQGSLLSDQIPDEPGINAFSLGTGVAVDIRPTVALLAEVIPTVVSGSELGIHRPAFSFAIQKKLYRHAFTFGLTTSPGTTISQRGGTNATFLNNPSADTPSGLFLDFDLTRQIH